MQQCDWYGFNLVKVSDKQKFSLIKTSLVTSCWWCVFRMEIFLFADSPKRDLWLSEWCSTVTFGSQSLPWIWKYFPLSSFMCLYIFKGFINLKWTKESGKPILPVFLLLLHIQLFSPLQTLLMSLLPPPVITLLYFISATILGNTVARAGKRSYLVSTCLTSLSIVIILNIIIILSKQYTVENVYLERNYVAQYEIKGQTWY